MAAGHIPAPWPSCEGHWECNFEGISHILHGVVRQYHGFAAQPLQLAVELAGQADVRENAIVNRLEGSRAPHCLPDDCHDALEATKLHGMLDGNQPQSGGVGIPKVPVKGGGGGLISSEYEGEGKGPKKGGGQAARQERKVYSSYFIRVDIGPV